MDNNVVIIKNFTIPKSCADCPICYDDMYCSITNSQMDCVNYVKTRHPDCPLFTKIEQKEV